MTALREFVFLADLHAHPWRDCSRNGGADRLDDALGVLDRSLAFADSCRCPWIFGGDAKRHRWLWPQEAQNGILAVLEKWSRVPKILFPGQHDGIGGRDGTGLRPFRNVANTALVESPCVQAFPEFGVREPMAFWPYTRTLEGLPDFLQVARKTRILFGHIFFEGAAVGPLDVRILKGATLEAFALRGPVRLFDAGFFGDIHKQQQLGKGSPKHAEVWYAGSPYAQNWGELEREKGCLHVTMTPSIRVTPMALGGPEYRKVDWTGRTEPPQMLGDEASEWKGHFVHLTVNADFPSDVLERLREQSEARAFQVIRKRAPKSEALPSAIHAGMERKQLLSEYVKAKPPVPGLDPKAVFLAGVRLMDEPKERTVA